MKTTTESILRTKALISWAYLLIAIGLIAITIFPTLYTKELQITFTHLIETGYHVGYKEMELQISGVLLCLLAIVYLIHFGFGAFHYPSEYRKVLREKYVPSITESIPRDNSFGRGIFASLAVCLVMYSNTYDVFIKYSYGRYLFWGILLIWLLLNLVLLCATSTSDMFERTSVGVRKSILTPWEQPNSSNDYEIIFFDYPVSESKEEWRTLVATAYAVSLKNEHDQIELQKTEAEKLSKKIIQNQ